MPKIIENIRDVIFTNAQNMFCSNGYDNVDMKTIAMKCDIAVGTLYNYYSNKKDLYLAVVKDSWDKTFKKLDAEKERSDEEHYIKNVVSILYDDIHDRRGLGSIIAKGRAEGDCDFIKLNEYIYSGVREALSYKKVKESFACYKEIENKITVVLMSAVPHIAMMDDNRDENIEIIYNAIKNYYK